MSFVDDSSNSELLAALAAEDTSEPINEPTSEPTPVAPVVDETPPLTDFGKRYVATIEDEQERLVADKHIRRWDAGVAKLQERYKGYESLGPVEELEQYRSLYQTLVHDPMKLAQYLHERGIVYQAQQAQQTAPASVGTEQPVDPSQEKISQLENAVLSLYQQRQQELAAQQEQAQIAEFHKNLDAAVPSEFSPQQKDMVVRLVAGGITDENGNVSIQAAVQAVQSLVQGTINQNARQQAPTLLGSSGAPPTTKTKSPVDLNDNQAKEMLVHLLQQG